MARILAFITLLLINHGSWAQAVTDQTQMVAKAVNTVERVRSENGQQTNISDKLARCRAVLVVPDLVKGGFLFGAEYGTGVLLTKSKDGVWSGPAFYSIASGSFGLQIGLQDAESVFIIMSDNGLSAIMNDKMKLGAAANVAIAVIGAGAEADTTTNTGADIYAYNNAAGLYAGVSLQGSGILPRHSWNAAYYGGNPLPEDILIRRILDSPQANRLRDVLSK
jgi:lipid-binding SYLF domain-containing protein